MITISEVIEHCAQVCDEQYPYSVFHTDQRAAKNCANALRAIKVQYEGYRVLEPDAAIYKQIADNYAKDCPHGVCPTMKNGVHVFTEPIKLLPLPEARKPDEYGVGWFTAGQMHAYVEQATAELRGLLERRRKKHEATFLELAISQRERAEAVQRAEKAEAEVFRNEADVDSLKHHLRALQAEADRLRALLTRYRNETPLGHQPHMIAAEVDATLKEKT